jgi:hypothetical protein
MAEDDMRRSNKASGAGAQGQGRKRTTHLDLPSNDDAGISKIHKSKKAGPNLSTIAVAVLCGIAAIGTLLYFSGKVSPSSGRERTLDKKGGGSQRFMAEQIALPPDSIYRTKVQDIHSDWQELNQYAGSVSLIVNVACE